MKNKLLTLVIPVYNVETYIRKCLDSLLIDSSLMLLMDVLIINDGTPDNSAEISHEYVKRYPDKLYSSRYRSCVHYPYSEGKKYLSEWNEWVREINSEMMAIWIRAYRILPYMLCRPLCMLTQWVISKYKTSERGPARYKKCDQ